jgi:hypothetical protein
VFHSHLPLDTDPGVVPNQKQGAKRVLTHINEAYQTSYTSNLRRNLLEINGCIDVYRVLRVQCPLICVTYNTMLCWMKDRMKTIDYRGGLVSFEIPTSWKEEYQPEGGGTFYEDRPDSGTLRLNVISFSSKEPKTPTEAVADAFGPDTHEILSSGLTMRRGMKDGEERSTKLHLYRWDVLVPVTATHSRLACFTYTVIADQDGTEPVKGELEMVEGMVRTARFSTAQGEAPRTARWKIWK